MDFIDQQAIEDLTGYPVRCTYRPSAGTRRTLPEVNALVIAPATYNSVNKIALGIADTYAMTSVSELIGRQIPTVIVPFVNAALAARAPFQRSQTCATSTYGSCSAPQTTGSRIHPEPGTTARGHSPGGMHSTQQRG